MPDATVNLELNSDEALVLFEFLSRYSNSDELTIEDPAEQRVLWNMCCDLEKTLISPFNTSYAQFLEAARSATRDSKG